MTIVALKGSRDDGVFEHSSAQCIDSKHQGDMSPGKLHLDTRNNVFTTRLLKLCNSTPVNLWVCS